MMATRLYIVAPIFGDIRGLFARTCAVLDWYYESRPRIASEYGIDVTKLFMPAPWGKLELHSEAMLSYSGAVPKGLAIRIALLAALDGVDKHGVEERTDAYVVQIDGSGAFKFESVFEVLKLLTKGESIVFGQRTGDKWFMSHKDRKCVELFENYLAKTWAAEVGSVTGPDWPDAQAGCWGLRMVELQNLGLTAPGYELEIDLFTSVLMSKRHFVFSPPLEEGVRITGSGMQLQDGTINYT